MPPTYSAVVPGVQHLRPGVKLALTSGITASSAALEHELRDAKLAVWPKARKPVIVDAASGSGKPIRDASNYRLGRVNPAFTIEVPPTTTGLAIGFCLLLQQESYGSGKYTFGQYTSQAATLFAHVEGGVSGLVYKAVGSVVRTLGLTIPPVGEDRGQASLRLDMIAANASRQAAFTAGSPVVDAGAPKETADFYLKLATAAKSFVGIDLSITNNAAGSPTSAETSEAILLGELGITGSLTVLSTTTSDEEYDQLMDAHEAKTTIEIEVGVSGHHKIVFDALIDSPEETEQGNVVVARFPFRAVYVDAGSFAAEVNSAADILNFAS